MTNVDACLINTLQTPPPSFQMYITSIHRKKFEDIKNNGFVQLFPMISQNNSIPHAQFVIKV